GPPTAPGGRGAATAGTRGPGGRGPGPRRGSPSRLRLRLAPNALAHRGVHAPRRFRRRGSSRPLPDEHAHDCEAERDGDERRQPDEEGESAASRREEDPLAVAVHEVLDDLGRALARLEPLAYDRAHLARHLRG